MAKCDICGKIGGFAPILKCTGCGKSVCARHDREQFAATTVSPDSESFLTNYTVLNYPSGETLKETEFRCYECRTGNAPTDMGKRMHDPVEMILVLMAITSLVLIGTIFLTGWNYLIYFLMLDVIISMALAFSLSKR